MMRHMKYLLCAMITAGAAATLSAQEEDGFDRTQIITGDRTLTVDKAFKITESPTETDIPVRTVDTTYTLIPRRPEVKLGTEPIEPARIKVREPLDPMYHGYVQGGVGTYQTPFLEAMFTSTRKRDFSYGVKYRHLSAHRSVRNVAFSGFSENEIAAWGKKIFSKHSLETKAAFSRDVFHYYGFDPQDTEISKGDIRQRFELFSLDNKWKSYYRDSSKVNHDLDLNIYNLVDRLGSSEFGVFAGGELHAYRGNQFYKMRTGFDLISYRSDGISPFTYMNSQVGELDTTGARIDNAIVHAVPQILLRTGNLSASVGMGIYLQVQNTGRFHAFPDAEVSYSLFNDILIPYAGITGSVNRVGYRTLTRTNPWVLNSLNLENSVTKYNVFGGFRGSISDEVSFNTRVSYTQTDDMPLFVNDIVFSTENRFNVIYDDIGTFSMLGELTYVESDKWEAFASVEILSYSTGEEEEAWHLPAHRISMGGKYNLFDKFSAGMTLNWIGARQVRTQVADPGQDSPDPSFASAELGAYLDLSLQAEYRYTSRISAFVEVHNLTASKYEIYYRFPAQRAFIMGGARYLF